MQKNRKLRKKKRRGLQGKVNCRMCARRVRRRFLSPGQRAAQICPSCEPDYQLAKKAADALAGLGEPLIPPWQVRVPRHYQANHVSVSCLQTLYTTPYASPTPKPAKP